MKTNITPEAFANIDLIAFDFDGVLTDNRVWVFEDGREAVACTRADGLGFDLLRELGISPVIVSTETNPVVSARARKVRVDVFQAVGDKGELLRKLSDERSIPLGRMAFVGNDINDLSALNIVGLPIVPADGHPDVRKLAQLVTSSRGGEGVVRELADLIRSARLASSS